MEKLYVVTGTTGEYSDRMIWIAKIFSEESEAKRYVDFMNKELEGSDDMIYKEREMIVERLKEFDSKLWHIDYTGAEYEMQEEVLSELPPALLK